MELKEGEGFGRAGEEQKKELQKRLSEGGDKDGALRARLEEKRRLADEALKAKTEAEKENGAINLSLYRLGEEIEETSEALQKHRLEKMEAEQRRDTLLRMERLLEGFSESVKEVMNAAGSELSGICGPVSKLITTKDDYILAVETALGGGVQNVVVESEKDAKDAIGFLKKNRLGRATFLPLNTLRPSLYDIDGIKEEGFVGRASDLCSSDEKYRVVVEFLLGKTLICRDIDSATALAKKEKYGVRIVTLDGQIIHAGGSFTGGQALHLTGVLSRSGDLSQLKDEIAVKEEKIALLRTEIDQKEEERASLRASLSENEKVLNELRVKAGNAQNELTLEAERMDAAKSDVLLMEKEILEIDEKNRQRKIRAEEIETLLISLKEREETITSELSEIHQKKEEQEKKREEYIIEQGQILTLRAQAQLRLEQQARLLDDNTQAFRLLEEGGKSKEALLAELLKNKEELLQKTEESKQQREVLQKQLEEKQSAISLLLARVNSAGEESAKIRSEQKEKQSEKERRVEQFSRLASRLAGAEKEREGIIRSLSEEYEISPEHMEFEKAKEIDTEALGGEGKLASLRAKLRSIGPVNLESVQELEEAQERFNFLNAQYSDITKSKEELEKLISDLESTMRDMFTETFEQIRYTFRQIFVELFGGGTADIELTNKEDLLNCGVEIRVQPPGKVIKNLSLLSGGEQAFVAIALYMSLLRINPSPFCIFDEIESALDEANVRRFAQYIKKHNDKTQFIVITHRRGTMEEADTLYGITMQEKGVSDFIRLDVSQSGKFASDGK